MAVALCCPNHQVLRVFTVSPIGLVNAGGAVVLAPNNGADFGPDTQLSNTGPGLTVTSGIQEAIAAAAAVGGAQVLLLPGLFSIVPPSGSTLAAIHVLANNIYLQGSGVTETTLDIHIVDDIDGVKFAQAGQPLDTGGMSDLTIQFTKSSGGGSSIVTVGGEGNSFLHVRFARLRIIDLSASVAPPGQQDFFMVIFVTNSAPQSGPLWIDECEFDYPGESPNLTVFGIQLNLIVVPSPVQGFVPQGVVIRGNAFLGGWPFARVFTTINLGTADLRTWRWKDNTGVELGWNIATPPLPSGTGIGVVNQNPWAVEVYQEISSFTGNGTVIFAWDGQTQPLPDDSPRIRLDPGFGAQYSILVPASWRWFGVS